MAHCKADQGIEGIDRRQKQHTTQAEAELLAGTCCRNLISLAAVGMLHLQEGDYGLQEQVEQPGRPRASMLSSIPKAAQHPKSIQNHLIEDLHVGEGMPRLGWGETVLKMLLQSCKGDCRS